MHSLILDLEKDYKKPQVVAVRSGDTVRVTQKIKEASKERLQMFEGLVIRVDRSNSVTCRMTVRKIASGIGVEKSFLIHSPAVVKVEVLRRAKVRRNYLSYMRQRVGKSARLKSIDFDQAVVNEFAQAISPLVDSEQEVEVADVEADVQEAIEEDLSQEPAIVQAQISEDEDDDNKDVDDDSEDDEDDDDSEDEEDEEDDEDEDDDNEKMSTTIQKMTKTKKTKKMKKTKTTTRMS